MIAKSTLCLTNTFPDKENSKLRNGLQGISDSWDFQQTHCFLHKDKQATVYNDEFNNESEDDCVIGGSKLGKAVVCQKSLAAGFGQHKLLTKLSVKTRLTTNFRNLTTETSLLQTLPYLQVSETLSSLFYCLVFRVTESSSPLM